MQLFSPDGLTWLTVAFYLLATLAGIVGYICANARLRAWGAWLAVASFLGQTLILIFGFHKLLPEGLSLGAYLQLLAWFALLCGIGAWLRLRQDAILLFAAPFALILFLLSAAWLDLGIKLSGGLSAPFYALHIGSLFLSLGLLALAFIAGVIFLFLEGRIKSKKTLGPMWADLPALALLDRINAICAMAAFPLYTLGIIAGLLRAAPVFGATFTGDPKEVASLVIWVLLALLFYMRLARGWQGRKPALLLCAIFLLSLFSLLIINVFLPTHHGVIHS